MVDKKTVVEVIWPVVEQLVEGTVAEDAQAVRRVLYPRGRAAEILELFGPLVFDVLLKTVLGRPQMGLARAIEAEQERAVYIEFAWPDPAMAENRYSAVDVVTVQLKRYRKEWRIVDVNPADAEAPMTEARALGILLTNQALLGQDGVPTEPWLLPVALFGGLLQFPLRQEGLKDPVERLFMPGLQHRSFGIISLVGGRRLWRDFVKKGEPTLENPSAWAAAVEAIMGEQTMRQVTQASISRSYEVTLGAMLPRLRGIKEALDIKGLDERYSPFGTSRVSVKE